MLLKCKRFPFFLALAGVGLLRSVELQLVAQPERPVEGHRD
jgi:hypothetical protein